MKPKYTSNSVPNGGDLRTTNSFKTSSYCASSGCVGVLRLDDGRILVTNTNSKQRQLLAFTPEEWTAFVSGVKDDQFDLGSLER
jgi:hypothetical protein